MGLTKIAITRPVFILMVMLASILMGAIGFTSMRLEENPDVSFGVISVVTVYPGASPDVVNSLVTRKVEDVVSGVPGLQEVQSNSQEGVSIVTMQFRIGTDMNAALNDTRAKVDTVLNNLPREVERPIVQKFDTSGEAVMTLSANSQTLSNREIRDLFDRKLRDRFARIDGVADVTVSGGEVREIQVQVKKDRLLAYGVGILDVQRAVQAASANIPSGRLVSGDKEFSVRVPADFTRVEDIRNMSLAIQDPNNPRGTPTRVTLSDVADVQDASRERTQYGRLNGVDAITVSIQKSKEGNAVSISNAIQKPGISGKSLLQEIKDDYDINVVVVNDAAVRVTESVTDLGIALGFGIFLVTVIVYIFLHNIRGTIIVGIAIPLCIFATFVAMWLVGFTLNNMTLLALSLAVGVLVDDCIVVIENIYRHLQMGEDPVSAAINGRSEIGLAAIAITLVDVVVFVPIGFMGGIIGEFFRPLAFSFVICVLTSLFVSFTVTPMLASRWYRAGEDLEHPRGGFAKWFENRFDGLVHAYKGSLEWALNHRWFVFISGFVVLVGMIVFIVGSFMPTLPAAVNAGVPLVVVAAALGLVVFLGNLFRGYVKPRFILFGVLFGLVFPLAAVVGFMFRGWKGEDVFKFAFFPPSDQGSVSVSIELPPGSSLEATQRVVGRLEEKVAQHPDVHFVLASVGSRSQSFGPGDTGTNYARITAKLHERKAFLDTLLFWVKHEEPLRTRVDTAVAADLLESIGRVPGANVTVSAQSGFGFGAPIQMSFLSDDRDALLKTVVAVRDGLKSGAIEGVVSPEISAKPGKPEIRAVPDRDRLATMGMTAQEVGFAMRALYEGDDQTKLRTGGEEYDVRVMMNLEDRNDPNAVRTVPITFSQGEPVFLADVATIQSGQSVDKIERRDKQEEIRVTADLLPGYAAGSVQANIDRWIQAEGLMAEGVSQRPGGQADVQARETGGLFLALGLGLILVYMLLASLFDNLLYPFIIQFAQPQALVGALLALVITDKTLNIVGFVGIIALVGLVGKNAILLVDYANTLRERGFNRHDALVQSGATRLRPIAMTTLAVILGMLPVALAIGRGSEFRETIGITIIGGITLSTILTLIVIPCTYTVFDDLSASLGKLFSRFRGEDDNGGGDPPIDLVGSASEATRVN